MYKNIYIGISILVIGFLIYFLLQKPDKVETIVEVPVKIEVPVPAKEGKSEIKYLPSPIKENPINKELQKKIELLQDSIAMLDFIKEELTERTYNNEFKDSTQSINVKSTVQGKLLNQSLNYYINPNTVKLDTVIETKIIYPTRIQLFGKVEIGNTIDIQNFEPVFKGDIIIKNKKDRLISLGIDTQERVWVGYGFKF
jgi:hypothetical protein